jgi:tetratricopeptide (TPR) repeat protein
VATAHLKDATVLADRGDIYLRLGRYPAAIADFDAALRISPQYAAALYGRGLTKRALGDAAGADADIAAAQRIDPDVARDFEGDGIKQPPPGRRA